ncbi:hypothetical protein ACWGM0_04610 [Sphingomonas bisphenolicum]
MAKVRALANLIAALSGVAAATPVATQGQTRVTNTATATWQAPTGPVSIDSNTVTFDVEARGKRPTRLSFRLLPVGYSLQGTRCETSPSIVFTPAPIDAADLARAPVAESIDTHVPLILVLDNPGGNHDPNLRETSWINVHTQYLTSTIPMMETGPDTGVFAGGVPQGNDGSASPCDPTLDRGAQLTLSFTEDAYSYGSTSSILIDPTGYVFDSETGALVDGATVTLLGEDGQPAKVFGDDGVSAYPSTVVSGGSTTDASGRLYDFPQGNYRFPLTAPGRYHLQVTPPAHYVAPSTRSRADLEALRGPMNHPFILNEASFGGVFALSDPEPFIADIPLDRVGDTHLLLTKTASVREASPGDFVQYLVRVDNRSDDDASGIHLTDILPPGLRYERGSTRGADEPVVATDGRTLDFTIPALPSGKTLEVRYIVSVAPGAPRGEALNRVLASGSAGATSNEAAASVRIGALLFTDGFTVVGRVTEGDCNAPAKGRKGVAGIRLLMEDGSFVVTDKDGLYHFEAVRPGRHVVQLDGASLPASHAPLLCDADTRNGGSATSRFVESAGGLLQRVDFQLRLTGLAAAAVADALPAAPDAAQAAGDREWFDGQDAGIALLFPMQGYNPRSPSTRVVIKHHAGQKVALRLNGGLVDALAYDATDTDGDIAIAKWSGLGLDPGDNALEATVMNADGSIAQTLHGTVHYAGAAANAIVAPDASKLAADGLTNPVLAFRLTDRSGRPVRDGTTVPVTVDQPYAIAVDTTVPASRRASGTALVIGDEGIAYLALQPTTQAGALRATVTLTDDKQQRAIELRARLTAVARDWTVVGFGSGTIGFDTLRRRSSALPASSRNSLVTDGQLALYAKGRIKGGWLMTIAYDSDRKYDRSRGLLGQIDPDRYYTVYGDATRQGHDAATARKLYLRLERKDFSALFGDFETGMTQTQLTRYSRTLNGMKADYADDRLSFSAFAANSDDLHARDEIQGNGLTGPYRLSGRDIVPNSDKLIIETRDRLRPERILSSTPLTRHIDYDIDATIGTIRFREPVLGRDAANNPVFIVVDYETYGKGKKLTAGGRAAMKFAKGKAEVGVSAIKDNSHGDGLLLGADVSARISDTTQLRAEMAAGSRDGLTDGRAWMAEIEHHSKKADVLAYARQQDDAFGLGQQNLVEAGTRRIGFDGRVQLAEKWALTASSWYQDQLIGAGSRFAGESRIEYRRDHGTIFAGAQFALDHGIDGKDRDSRLLTLGGIQILMGGKLTLTGQTQFAPGGDRDSVDFPARHQLIAAWRVKPGIRLIGGYEVAQGEDYTTHTAQIGFDVQPWTGAKVTTAINNQTSGENGGRVYANYGLVQSLPIGDRWTIDATFDASTTVSGKIPAGGVVQPFQTSGSGSVSGGALGSLYGNDGDYAAVTLGANYRADLWSWNGRVEYRKSDQNKRFNITSNVVRALGEGKTLAGTIRYSTLGQVTGAQAKSLATSVALAWRPLDSRWSLLERLELRKESADAGVGGGNVLGVPAGSGVGQRTTRLINNLAVNYRTGDEGTRHNVEATVYYGAKWVSGSYGADDYTGYIDVTGFDLRMDLGKRFDIGVQASAQHAWSRGAVAFSGGPSAGLSPAPNVWISAGYNIAGYRDRDFEDDRYTRRGPYVTMRMKFDRNAIAGLLGKGR